LSWRNNILLSVEDEWPTFLLCYSHLILPLSPLTVALTDYTWQRLDEGRRWLGGCLLWRNRCSWMHSSTKAILKKKIKPLRAKYTQHKGERITRKSLYIKLGILAGKID